MRKLKAGIFAKILTINRKKIAYSQLCVCVCVCVRDRERQGDRKSERKEREGEILKTTDGQIDRLMENNDKQLRVSFLP